MEKDVKDLVIARLENLPSNIKISVGGLGSFTKSELIKAVEEEDELGERVAEIQLAYIRSFVKR